jgi:methyl-accepting chemotaxis protein
VALLGAMLLLLPATVAACGSSDSSDEEQAKAYADGLCGALSTWKGSIASVGTSLKDVSKISASSLQQAADDVSAANSTLADDLDELGEPPDFAGSDAKSAVDDLRDELGTSADKIKDATKDVSNVTEALQAVNTASAALLAMSTDISTTVATLESLDADETWKQAFADSEECTSLGKS